MLYPSSCLCERMYLVLKVLELYLVIGHPGRSVPDDDGLELAPEELGPILLQAVEVIAQPSTLLLCSRGQTVSLRHHKVTMSLLVYCIKCRITKQQQNLLKLLRGWGKIF